MSGGTVEEDTEIATWAMNQVMGADNSIDTAVLEETIRRVLAKLPEASSGNDGVFVDMDSAIAAATKASREYLSRSLADRRRYVQAIRTACCARRTWTT